MRGQGSEDCVKEKCKHPLLLRQTSLVSFAYGAPQVGDREHQGHLTYQDFYFLFPLELIRRAVRGGEVILRVWKERAPELK